jgi:repressor LexA
MVEGLTKRQKEALDFVAAYTERHGYPPTVRELASALGISGPKGAKQFLDALASKGYIRREPENARAIRIVGEGAGQGAPPGIPVVGRVAAGRPITAVEDLEGYVSLYGAAGARGSGGLFFLKVKGDSMIGAHIAPGDLVLVRPQEIAETGDIVVALIDGEATVKRYKKDAGSVTLFPENAAMEPIVFVGEAAALLTVVGKVVGVVRDLEGGLVVPE